MVSRSVGLLGSLLALAVVSSPALARWNVPVENVENAPIVTASGKAIPPGAIRDAFIFAGKRYNWEFSGGPDQLVGTTTWNNKHSISIDILYTSDHYTIRYRDSRNMSYDPHNGAPVIHPEYNRRVKQLIDEFSNELRRY